MLRPRGNWRTPWRKPWGYPLQDWTPAQLFADGAQGVWYDPSDPTTVFQDAAGTTPAFPGDPVGLLKDKSGNGYHATQATAAQRPVLRKTAGGLCYLEFDGLDDLLRTAAFGATITQPISASVAGHVKNPAASATQRFFDGADTARVLIGKQSATESLVFAGVELRFPDPFALDVYTGIFNGASSIARLGGVQVAAGNAGTAGLNGLTLGASFANGERLTGYIFGLVLAKGIWSAANIAKAEAYLAQKSGVVL